MRGYIFQVDQAAPEFLVFTEDNPEILVRLSEAGIMMYDLNDLVDGRLVTMVPEKKTFTIDTLVFEFQGTVDDITQFPTYEHFPDHIVKAMTAINK